MLSSRQQIAAFSPHTLETVYIFVRFSSADKRMRFPGGGHVSAAIEVNKTTEVTRLVGSLRYFTAQT